MDPTKLIPDNYTSTDIPPAPLKNNGPHNDTNQTGTPSNQAQPPNIVSANVPTIKKRGSRKKKIVATILGILLMISGLGTGIYLSQRSQDIREKAKESLKKCDNFDYSLCNPDGTCKEKGKCQGCCRGQPSTLTLDLTRPDLCISASADKYKLGPGETITVSSKSKESVNYFMYSVYNMDNLYPSPPENNPKPVCVKNGGDITTVRDICPEGSHLLIFEDPNKELRTEGKRTIRYEDLFVKDELTGQVVSNISITAYFQKEEGSISVPKPECVVRTISSKTPSLQPECLDIKVYTKDGETWVLLDQNDLSSLEPGDKIYLTVTGRATDPTKFTKAKFKINNKEEVEVAASSNKKPTDKPDEAEIFYEYIIPPKVNSFTIKAAIYHQELGWIGTTKDEK